MMLAPRPYSGTWRRSRPRGKEKTTDRTEATDFYDNE